MFEPAPRRAHDPGMCANTLNLWGHRQSYLLLTDPGEALENRVRMEAGLNRRSGRKGLPTMDEACASPPL